MLAWYAAGPVVAFLSVQKLPLCRIEKGNHENKIIVARNRLGNGMLEQAPWSLSIWLRPECDIPMDIDTNEYPNIFV